MNGRASSDTGIQTLSWRDPAGFVMRHTGRILRAVAPARAAETRTLLRSPWLQRLVESKAVPATVELAGPPDGFDEFDGWLWLSHEVLPFPCYPHEITAAQLHESARLTLEVAAQAAREGMVLKDASAWNVLHSEGRPVFVDLLSFDPLGPQGTWIAYGQFARHFLLPLLLYRELGMTPQEIFELNRDGIVPEQAYRLLGGRRLLSRVALEHILLPKWLAGAGGRRIAEDSGTARPSTDPAIAAELLQRTLDRLRRAVARLEPAAAAVSTVWRDYEEDRSHYTQADLAAKKDFVGRHLADSRSVLDLGCNAGEYSLLAAEGGRRVVAADVDHGALSRLNARLGTAGVSIAPVMVNIARPTPGIGWENREVASFLDRARGQFDCILVLGLVHHLIVSERATLAMIVDLLDGLEPKTLIVEWIDPDDRRFKQVAGLNAALYRELNCGAFEASLARRFRVSDRLVLPSGTRTMLFLTR